MAPGQHKAKPHRGGDVRPQGGMGQGEASPAPEEGRGVDSLSPFKILP